MKFRASFRIATILAIAVLAISSCRQKDDPATAAASGNFKLQFTNSVGSAKMVIGNDWYVNANNDSFKIWIYKYYISNIVLHGTDGSSFAEQEGYHLVDEADPATCKFSISNVPAGKYSSITFLIGVDSLHNVSGAQTGDLDPMKGMIWDWNTGYIMAKMEGYATTAPTIDHHFAMHIAGFKGDYNVLQTVTLQFPEPAIVGGDKAPNAHLFCDALEWFKNPAVIDIASYSNVTVEGKKAKQIATNYADMFRVDHIDN